MTIDEEMLLAIRDSDEDSDIGEFIIISTLQRHQKVGIRGSKTGKARDMTKF